MTAARGLVLLAMLLAGIASYHVASNVKTISGVYDGVAVVAGGDYWGLTQQKIGNVTVLKGLIVLHNAYGVVHGRNLTCTPTTGLAEGWIVAVGDYRVLEGNVTKVGPYNIIHGKAFLLNACLYKP
ncbi:MAG: hypothetical protein F9Y92_05650 [Thermoplasmatales archaeon]|jgi:carbonic anhydrase/acetyltransferase-like protein (isoleucine patch superfamily)|nr:hypothetical protein [Thermoplasmatales archaeon]